MKCKLKILFFSLIFGTANIYSQDAPDIVASHAAYAEAGGSSVAFSFNYDFRFHSSFEDGFGLRIGAGGYAIGDSYLLTAPIMLNFLGGKNGRYFEGGAGVIVGAGSDGPLNLVPDGFPLAGTFYMGYRSQPVEGGLVFRAGVPFLFGVEPVMDYITLKSTSRFFATPWWPGVSIGYAF